MQASSEVVDSSEAVTTSSTNELDEILALRDQVNKFQMQEQKVHSKLANLEEQYTDKSSKIMIEMQRKLVHAELQEKTVYRIIYIDLIIAS